MDDIQNNIGFWLVQVCKAHHNRAEAALNNLGLYAGQEFALLLLSKQEGISQSELAGELCVEAPTVTKMLQRMEKAGLIERRESDSDARVSQVFLTGLGRNLQEPILEIWHNLEDCLLRDLNPIEQALLRRLLMQVHTNLTESTPEEAS